MVTIRTIIVIILATAVLFLTWLNYSGTNRPAPAPRQVRTITPDKPAPAVRHLVATKKTAVPPAHSAATTTRPLDLSISTTTLAGIAERNELHTKVQKKEKTAAGNSKGVDISSKLLFDDKAEKTTEMINGAEINIKVPFD